MIRREPATVAGWIAIWLAAPVALGLARLVFGEPAPPASAHGRWQAVAAGLGPLWPIAAPILIALWIMTSTTVFRAVLAPQTHGWRLIRFGPDEARLAVVTAAGFLLVVLFGSAPAAALFLLAQPVLALAPHLARWTLLAGVLATVAVEVWIAVRLSLAPVYVIAERQLSLIAYWQATEGMFWALLRVYFLVFLQVVACVGVLGLAGVVLTGRAMALIASGRADPIDRVVAVGLAVAIALVGAALFVLPLIALAAAQARAWLVLSGRTPALADGRPSKPPGLRL